MRAVRAASQPVSWSRDNSAIAAGRVVTPADVLDWLATAGPHTTSEIARHFGYANSAPIRRRLRELDARGVVTRTPGERGRRLWDVRR